MVHRKNKTYKSRKTGKKYGVQNKRRNNTINRNKKTRGGDKISFPVGKEQREQLEQEQEQEQRQREIEQLRREQEKQRSLSKINTQKEILANIQKHITESDTIFEKKSPVNLTYKFDGI